VGDSSVWRDTGGGRESGGAIPEGGSSLWRDTGGDPETGAAIPVGGSSAWRDTGGVTAGLVKCERLAVVPRLPQWHTRRCVLVRIGITNMVWCIALHVEYAERGLTP